MVVQVSFPCRWPPFQYAKNHIRIYVAADFPAAATAAVSNKNMNCWRGKSSFSLDVLPKSSVPGNFVGKLLDLHSPKYTPSQKVRTTPSLLKKYAIYSSGERG